MSRNVSFLVISAVLFLCGCGGSLTQSPANPGPSAGVNPGAPAPPPAGPLAGAQIVSVNSGQAVTGVDIAVSMPADSPTPNAEMLGVTALGNGGSAHNVGDLIHRGTKMTVLMFGTGLNGSLAVTISGPSDITVSNVRDVTSIDGTSGVAFDAMVDASAALGARTVRLRSQHDDVTTFTGGLEVVP